MNDDRRNVYITREAILNLLSPQDLAQVSWAEDGPPLPVGEEYIELDHLDHGIRRMRPTTPIDMRVVLARRSVAAATWTLICARLSEATRVGGR